MISSLRVVQLKADEVRARGESDFRLEPASCDSCLLMVAYFYPFWQAPVAVELSVAILRSLAFCFWRMVLCHCLSAVLTGPLQDSGLYCGFLM